MTSAASQHISIQQNVPLAPLTTIGLGGSARLFVSCRTLEQLCEALQYAGIESSAFTSSEVAAM